MLEHFRKRCQKFLTTLGDKKNLVITLLTLKCLHRKITMSFGEPQRPASLVNIASSVPRIISPKDLDLLQKIDDQWRSLPSCDFPGNYKEMANNEFSGTLAELKSGERECKELGDFALNVFALPF